MKSTQRFLFEVTVATSWCKASPVMPYEAKIISISRRSSSGTSSVSAYSRRRSLS